METPSPAKEKVMMKRIIAVVAAIVSLVGVCVGDTGGVKYRGVFVNDEDWSLRPWAERHFGKEEHTGRKRAEVLRLLQLQPDGRGCDRSLL